MLLLICIIIIFPSINTESALCIREEEKSICRGVDQNWLSRRLPRAKEIEIHDSQITFIGRNQIRNIAQTQILKFYNCSIESIHFNAIYKRANIINLGFINNKLQNIPSQILSSKIQLFDLRKFAH